MITTTYTCDNCGAQSPTGTGFSEAAVTTYTGVSNTALLCPACVKASTDASQAALTARKGTQTGVVLP